VTEEDTRTGGGSITESVEEFGEAGDPCEVETGERKTRGGQVNMCIDERGRHPGTAQVDRHCGITGMQLCARIITDPRDAATYDEHGSREGILG
jgi:hypothetical protein